VAEHRSTRRAAIVLAVKGAVWYARRRARAAEPAGRLLLFAAALAVALAATRQPAR
jgi:hypothetical protein